MQEKDHGGVNLASTYFVEERINKLLFAFQQLEKKLDDIARKREDTDALTEELKKMAIHYDVPTKHSGEYVESRIFDSIAESFKERFAQTITYALSDRQEGPIRLVMDMENALVKNYDIMLSTEKATTKTNEALVRYLETLQNLRQQFDEDVRTVEDLGRQMKKIGLDAEKKQKDFQKTVIQSNFGFMAIGVVLGGILTYGISALFGGGQ